MRKYNLLLATLIMLLLSGCGKESVPLSNDTYPISFVLDQTIVCTVEIPANETLLYSDNSSYYEFTSGTKIMAASTQVHTTEKSDPDLQNIYYSKTGCSVDVGSSSITVKCDKKYVDRYKLCLFNHSTIYTQPEFESVKQLNKLPEKYTNKADVMSVTPNGNYMPMETLQTVSGVYTADLITYDGKWCKSWIQDGLYSDIQSIAMAYVTCACPEQPITEWYVSPDKDLVYITNGNCIFAAKALHYNAWVVYYTSTNFVDYVRTAMDVVHAE